MPCGPHFQTYTGSLASTLGKDTLKKFLSMKDKMSGFTGAVQSFFEKVGETAVNVWNYIVSIFKK